MKTDQSRDHTRSKSPISILACGGSLPLEVAEILRSAGRHPNIVSIAGMADADFSGFNHTSVSIGKVGELLAALRANGIRDMVIAGHASRPDLRSLNIDLGFARHILTILSLTRGGDDYVLRKIASFFERCGLTVRGIAEVAPSLLTPPGTLTGTLAPDAEHNAIEGLRMVHKLGPFDVGQALVMEGDQIIAIEGAEGTDGLLTRLPASTPSDVGRNARRLLVKAAKPDQDLRVDLPTIGAATIERCNSVGIRQIALEAGRSLIVSRTETLRQAAAANVAVVGLNVTPAIKRCRTLTGGTRLASHSRWQPNKGALRDARKGLLLLAMLSQTCPASATLVSRDNILAININEPLSEFLARSKRISQWGDTREKRKRNRIFVLSSIEALQSDTLNHAVDAKISGLAVLKPPRDAFEFDQLLSDANDRRLFVLSAE